MIFHEIRNTVLIVEDSKTFSSLLQRRINQVLGLKTIVAASLAEAKELVYDYFDEIFVALLDLNLPDAPDGEVIAPVLAHGIPAIVFTGSYSDDIRERVLACNVIDYVLKESSSDLDYLLKRIDRLRKNQNTKIMVVDDSVTTRLFIMNLLRLHKFNAIEADSGKRALELLEMHTDTRLVITDYNMPEMDGFELTSRIRTKYSREKLAVIGISAHGSGMMSARFLKKGANDFLVKPFVTEEFFCRIEQNLEMMEYIEEINFLSQRDLLTGLGNRRHFFETAPKILSSAKQESKNISVTMLDIDHFKKINDTFGHDGGDAALRHIASILKEYENSRATIARFGGEEFCIIFIDDAGDASDKIESLRQRVAASPVFWQEQEFSMSVSLGHICSSVTVLEDLLSVADKLLYKAKQSGRNMVVELLS